MFGQDTGTAVTNEKALVTKRRRGPHNSAREQNCPPQQVASGSIEHCPSRACLASATGSAAGCRVSESAGRSRSSKSSVGQHTPRQRKRRQALSRKTVRWFLHSCPPKKEKQATKPRSELLPLKFRQNVRWSVSLIATCAPSKVHETFERRSVFRPQIETTTRRQRYGLNGRNQFVRRHLRNAFLRQLSDGNFVEVRLLIDVGDLHSWPQEKEKHGHRMDWKKNSFLLVILSSAAGLSRTFFERFVTALDEFSTM
jgi:hypothetical protein